MIKVDAYKEKISHTICMDATDEFTVRGLPLMETDVVIVAIGEDQGANVMVTALLKNLEVKRLISRAINPLHEKVLQAIGVDEIVHPEEETAERWAKKLCINNVIDSFELNPDYSIIEARVPVAYIGKSIREISFRRNHKILALTVIKKEEQKSIFGRSKEVTKILGVISGDYIMAELDILVLYGANKDLQFFLKKKFE
jgi:trk system potassium uptake protein TrkA